LCLTILMCMALTGDFASAGETVGYVIAEDGGFAPDGFSLSRTESEAGTAFSGRLRDAALRLTGSYEPSEENGQLLDRIRDAAAPYRAEDEETPLDRILPIALPEPFGTDEAFVETLSGLLTAALPARTEDQAAADGLFVIPSEGGEEFIVGLSEPGRYVSLFFLGQTEENEPTVAAQLVYTEWGLTIGQSSPETGVIRPDGSFSVLAPGEVCFSLTDSVTLDEADAFALTAYPGAEQDKLTISAEGGTVGELTLQVGDVIQLAPVRSADGPLSLVCRTEQTVPLPDALVRRVEDGMLIPALRFSDSEEQPARRILRILG